jgi:hypothetical protein
MAREIAVVEFIAFGARDDMVAEVAAYDHSAYEGFDGNAAEYAFLVMPVGDAQWDTEGFASLADAKAHAEYLADANGGVPVARF